MSKRSGAVATLALAAIWAERAGAQAGVGGTTNPRLALVWDAVHDHTAKPHYGEAFRAPSFNEQYGINPVSNGNPDLRLETIRTLEAAFVWQARRVPNPAPESGALCQNAGGQHGYGMELEAAWAAGRNPRVSGNHAWQRSVDEATGRDAGYAPYHHLYARADWRLSGAWQLGGQFNWVADRKRADGDVRAELDDYATVDLSPRGWKRAGHWDVAFIARNLFDTDAREPSLAPGLGANDLPLPGRGLTLELRYQ